MDKKYLNTIQYGWNKQWKIVYIVETSEVFLFTLWQVVLHWKSPPLLVTHAFQGTHFLSNIVWNIESHLVCTVPHAFQGTSYYVYNVRSSLACMVSPVFVGKTFSTKRIYFRELLMGLQKPPLLHGFTCITEETFSTLRVSLMLEVSETCISRYLLPAMKS